MTGLTRLVELLPRAERRRRGRTRLRRLCASALESETDDETDGREELSHTGQWVLSGRS
jgi:hypothetical protein